MRPFHFFEKLIDTKVFAVDSSESRDVDKIVLESLQVECLNILQYRIAIFKASLTKKKQK